MRQRRVLLFACRLAIGACLLGNLHWARASDETLRIIVGGIEKQIYLPAALAQSLGYFKEQGLDVKLSSETSGVHAEDELLTGTAQGVVGFYDHTIELQAKGKFVQCVVQFSQAPGEAEVVASRMADQLRSPGDFKGRTLGVTGFGSSTHFLTQYLAAVHGVNDSEMRVIVAGSGTTFIKAMREGRIDAGMTTEPTVSHLLQRGEARLLVDLRTPGSAEKFLGGVYPGACLYMTSLWMSTHRPQVQRLVNAMVAALRYIDGHSAEEIAAQVPAAYYLGDAARYITALRESKTMFLVDGVMPPSGPQTVLKVMKMVNRTVKGRPIDLSRTYTTEFVSVAH